VKGKAKDPGHYRRTGTSEDGLPHVAMDYAFIRDDSEDEIVPVAVIGDYETRVVLARVVEREGALIEHVIEQITDGIARCGHKDMVLRCDQEPALVSVAMGIKEAPS
jgi:hypothetical protein